VDLGQDTRAHLCDNRSPCLRRRGTAAPAALKGQVLGGL